MSGLGLKRERNGMYRPLRDRFFDKVAMCPMSGCWLWTARVDKKGYGHIAAECSRKSSPLAHRTAYELLVGPIPDGLCALHRCDVPCCVNPAHLFLGTHLDNAQDRDRKGRTARKFGEESSNAKLTSTEVLTIRELYKNGDLLQREIGDRFGIRQTYVSRIVHRKAWSHL